MRRSITGHGVSVSQKSARPPGPPEAGEVAFDVAYVGIYGSDASERVPGPSFTLLIGPHPMPGHQEPMVGLRVRREGRGDRRDVAALSVADRVTVGAGCGAALAD